MKRVFAAALAAVSAFIGPRKPQPINTHRHMDDPKMRGYQPHARARYGTRANNKPGTKRPLARWTPYQKTNYRRSDPLHFAHPDHKQACPICRDAKGDTRDAGLIHSSALVGLRSAA